MSSDLSRRDLTAALHGIEWRTPPDGDSTYIQAGGHAAVFNRLSEPLAHPIFGRFREQIEPGAFRDVLSSDPDVRLLIDHNPSTVLARTRGETLMLRESETGLDHRARIPAALRDAQDLRVRMEHRLVTQMSFAFVVGEQREIGESDDGYPIMSVRNVAELRDASYVTYPAYSDTDAALRSIIPGWETVEYRRDYSAAERKELAKSGKAMPNGSFPIVDREDLEDAIKLAGHANDVGAAKRHIRKRAKALGLSNLIPDSWDSDNDGDEDDRTDSSGETTESMMNSDVGHRDGPNAEASATETTPVGSEDAAHRLLVVRTKISARRRMVEMGIEIPRNPAS